MERRSSSRGAGAKVKSGKSTVASAKQAAPARSKYSTIQTAKELSPRLLQFGAAGPELHTAPLLPEPPSEPEDRFCTHGPVLSIPSTRTRKPQNAAPLPFPDLVTYTERSISQAVLLLNDRLRSFTIRLKRAGGVLSEKQTAELCEIADGISAASYHVQKWAHLLSDGASRAPIKPLLCDQAEEAIAVMHCAAPRIMIGSAEAHRHLSALLKQYGVECPSVVEKSRIPIGDIRAMAPHLETFLSRLGHLCSSEMPLDTLKKFILEYFGPPLGPEPVKRLVQFLGLAQPISAW